MGDVNHVELRNTILLDSYLECSSAVLSKGPNANNCLEVNSGALPPSRTLGKEAHTTELIDSLTVSRQRCLPYKEVGTQQVAFVRSPVHPLLCICLD